MTVCPIKPGIGFNSLKPAEPSPYTAAQDHAKAVEARTLETLRNAARDARKAADEPLLSERQKKRFWLIASAIEAALERP